MNNHTWRVIYGAIATACAFLLIQSDVQLDPLVKMLVGLVSVVVAYIKAPPDAENLGA